MGKREARGMTLILHVFLRRFAAKKVGSRPKTKMPHGGSRKKASRKDAKSQERKEIERSWFLRKCSLRPYALCVFARKILLEKQEIDGS
jgi:hypothetical protein